MPGRVNTNQKMKQVCEEGRVPRGGTDEMGQGAQKSPPSISETRGEAGETKASSTISVLPRTKQGQPQLCQRRGKAGTLGASVSPSVQGQRQHERRPCICVEVGFSEHVEHMERMIGKLPQLRASQRSTEGNVSGAEKQRQFLLGIFYPPTLKSMC